MKKILFAILLLPFCAMAQDTAANQCRLIKETDPYTKETKLSTGFVLLDGGSVTIDADSKEIIVLFSLDGQEKCFDNNGTADVFFEGETRQVIRLVPLVHMLLANIVERDLIK